jgi:hypothetical protein
MMFSEMLLPRNCPSLDSQGIVLALALTVRRHQLAGLQVSNLFRARRLDVILCRIRNTSCRMTQPAREYHELRVIRFSQNFAPHPETDEHFIGHSSKRLCQGRVFFYYLFRHSLHHRANVLDGEIALAGHHGGVSEHMLITGRIENDETLRLTENLAIAAIGLDCFQVRGDGLIPMTDTNIDMRRHMHIVSESRLQIA